MTEQIKDIRVIERVDIEDKTKSTWRLQIDYGDGWQNVKVRITTNWLEFDKLYQGME